MTARTNGQRWWNDQIEHQAYARLQQLRQDRLADGTPVWNGLPPVPVEHIAERLLGLSIVRDEDIAELEGEEILGCIRPESKEIVLNQKHSALFERFPGKERYTISHEIGHADVFGEVATATEQQVFRGLDLTHTPKKRSAPRGDVQILGLSFTPAMKQRLAQCSPDEKIEVLRRFRTLDNEQMANGADSPLVRRAVDHYAATLLMPRDLVTDVVRDSKIELTAPRAIHSLAQTFEVSVTAMRIRLEELGFIHGVDEATGRVLLDDPSTEGQMKLL